MREQAWWTLRALWMRLRGLGRGIRREQEMAAELESHIAMQAEDNERAGMDASEARRQAILKLGGLEPTRQAYRERDTLPWVEHGVQDLRFALRQLGKNPGFAITAILILALGIAASVALFAFVDAALLKPLPYWQPGRITAVYETTPLFPRSNLSYPDYLDWKRSNRSFESLDMWGSGGSYLLRAAGGSEPVTGARVSDGFFRTLGVKPILGRDFYAGEDLPSGPRTVILSWRAWQHRYGGRRDVIGQAVSLSGIPYTVVGILPREFHFAPRGAAEFWTPFHAQGQCELNRGCHSIYGVARLKGGVSIAQANAEMKNIAAQLERQYPDSNRGQGANVIALSEVVVGQVRPILLVLLSGAGLLLLIACANVSSLLLVRTESRKRETAVRGALGASPLRLARQFVTEGLVLVVAGTSLGLAAAYGAMHALLRLVPAETLKGMPYLTGLGLTPRVLLFAAAIALVATVLFALPPMLRLPRAQLQEGLSEGGRSAAGTLWRRLGANLVIAELAIAMVLLVGAGLLGKSLYRLLHVDLGFQPDHLATMGVEAPYISYAKDEQQVQLHRRVLERISSLPGIASVALTTVPPVTINGNTQWLRFEGKPFHGEHNEVLQRDVSADYFKTIGATIAHGRAFTADDNAGKPLVAVINRALARQYYPGEDAVGKRLGNSKLDPKTIKVVVGVVDDFREGPLDEDIWPAIYYPISQDPDTEFSVIARTKQDSASLLPAIVEVVHSVDPDLGVEDETTMTLRMEASETAYLHRSAAWMVGCFAALAALLGVVGLYGVVAYSVGQRTREIGVRMALGAQRSAIYGLVLKEACRLTVLGVASGLLCSVALLSLMGKLLFQVKAWDLPTLAGVSVALGVAALIASYLPAHRAASVDPVEALRAE